MHYREGIAASPGPFLCGGRFRLRNTNSLASASQQLFAQRTELALANAWLYVGILREHCAAARGLSRPPPGRGLPRLICVVVRGLALAAPISNSAYGELSPEKRRCALDNYYHSICSIAGGLLRVGAALASPSLHHFVGLVLLCMLASSHPHRNDHRLAAAAAHRCLPLLSRAMYRLFRSYGPESYETQATFRPLRKRPSIYYQCA